MYWFFQLTWSLRGGGNDDIWQDKAWTVEHQYPRRPQKLFPLISSEFNLVNSNLWLPLLLLSDLS